MHVVEVCPNNNNFFWRVRKESNIILRSTETFTSKKKCIAEAKLFANNFNISFRSNGINVITSEPLKSSPEVPKNKPKD